jgi:hypothetical protein
LGGLHHGYRPAACGASNALAVIFSQHGHIITDFVAQARERVRLHRNQDSAFGIYVVPVVEARRAELVGKRIAALAPHVDFIAPMLYHTMVHQPPEWVEQMLEEAAQIAPGKVLPVLQVDSAEGHTLGADWGPPLPVDEWRTVAHATLQRGDIRGMIAFTGTALFTDGRGDALWEFAG